MEKKENHLLHRIYSSQGVSKYIYIYINIITYY